MIKITIESRSSHNSRFNLIVMCGGVDKDNNKLYVDAVQRLDGEEITTLECAAADRIELIVYFIPKLLPKGKNAPIVDHPPFPASVKVERGEEEIYSQEHQINGWGGAAIRLEL